MNYIKAFEIVILKKLAEKSSAGSFARKLYNNERLRVYRGHLMRKQDVDHLHSVSQNQRKNLMQTYAKQYPYLADETVKKAFAILKRMGIYDVGNPEYTDDILFCKFAYGIEPDEYISYNFMEKSDSERVQFVSDRELMYMVYQLNDRVDIQIYNDKAETFKFFKEYYKRDGIIVKNESDYSAFCSFSSKHSTFVKKKVNEAMGKGIELMTVLPENAHMCFEQILREGKHLLEEKVEQDESLASFNKSSVNTLRLITFNTKTGIEIPFGFAKFGRDGSFVDNGGAGGIFVGIDIRNGTLITNGYDELGHVYEEHPDSHKVFKGFSLPNFDEVLSIAKELSSKTPSVKYIGWDFAFSKAREWVVIEGNGMSQLIGPQSVFQRGVKDKVNAIMANMDLIGK